MLEVGYSERSQEVKKITIMFKEGSFIQRLFSWLRRRFLKIFYIRNKVEYARKLGVRIGKGSNFVSMPSFGSEPWIITIGDNVNVSSNVSFITHDGGRWVLDHLYPNEAPFYKIEPITLKNNIFIGANTMILPGVVIGNNCVVGGGSIVTKSIPDGEVWAGVPAKKVCTIEEYKERMMARKIPINFDNYWRNKEKEIKRVFKDYLSNNE